MSSAGTTPEVESDAALGDAETEVIHHQLHGRYHVGEVEQRLAHAHHHHVGDGTLATHHFGGTPHLADDLGDFQVAVEPCWAVEQKVQARAQPTWEETHRVARSASGM